MWRSFHLKFTLDLPKIMTSFFFSAKFKEFFLVSPPFFHPELKYIENPTVEMFY